MSRRPSASEYTRSTVKYRNLTTKSEFLTYAWVEDSDDLDLVVEKFLKKSAFVFDVETVGENRLDPLVAEVVWISLAADGDVYVIPMGHPNGELLEERFKLNKKGEQRLARGVAREDMNPKYDFLKEVERLFDDPPPQLSRGTVFQRLEPLFETPIRKIGHNIKYDLHAVTKYMDGLRPEGPYFDTMIISWLFDVSRKGRLTLDQCYFTETGKTLEKGVGKHIEYHSFTEVADYSALDAHATWEVYESLSRDLRRADDATRYLADLEMSVLHPVLEMESTGVRIDKARLREIDKELRESLDECRARLWKIAGRKFNVNSNADKQELLFLPKSSGGQGLKPVRVTPASEKKSESDLTVHDYAVDHATLVRYSGNQFVDALIEYSAKNKLHGTYVLPYLGGTAVRGPGEASKEVVSRLRDGKVYAQFKQHGAESGRFSCVAGETLLETSRGVFRFDDYLPEQGDLVLTHAGRWMPVIRKIYKGTDKMYRICAGGKSLLCTLDHRLWTPDGWKRVGDLAEGDAVVCLEELGRDLWTRGSEAVQGRRQADAGGTGRVVGHDVPKRPGGGQGGTFRGGIPGGEGVAVFTVEDRVEPYAGQEWFPTSWVQGFGSGRQGIPHRAEGRRSGVPASSGAGSGVGDGRVAVLAPRSSSGRGQGEQRAGQLGTGYPGRSSVPAQVTSRVDSITFVGAMGVWDIEVAGDHSYAAHGFLNHNSANPNLQNIPSRSTEGRKLRDVFIAEPGHQLIVADYSQIEPRIVASLSGDKTMIDTYNDGGDVYLTVADRMGLVRSAGKELVLSITYGVGAATIAQRIGCTAAEARDLMDFFARKFPAIPSWKNRVISDARRKRYSETLFGRRRPLPQIVWSDKELRAAAERQAVNHWCQGTAADIMKIALVNIYSSLPEEVRMLMTVHDEVVVQAPTGLVLDVIETVRTEMEGARPSSLLVPLVADVHAGHTWGEAKG